MTQTVRVGFIVEPGNWLGGRNYLRNLFAALHSVPGNPVTPVILSGTRQNDPLTDFPGVQVVQTSLLDRKGPAWLTRKIIAKATSHDLLLGSILRHHEVSVISHVFRTDSKTGVKTIGWIPDFQHVHLPEFFNPTELRRRDREYMDLCVGCDKVIVSSKCAAVDLLAFSPEFADKAELLRFVASPISLREHTSLPDLQQLYGFNEPYFLLPNQFWAHKNHRVVLSALRILMARNTPVLVLATGSTEDNRNPSFFPSLMQFAGECGVLDRFRVLGQVPFDHLVGLMRHAVAFLNPSKFEGWSTSVEEAKSMGKSVLLSDLPVHREQAPDRGIFFPPDDPEALADAMIAAYNGFDPQHDTAMQELARAQFPRRQLEFAEAYCAIVERVAGRHNFAR